jgi:hypothetical protein
MDPLFILLGIDFILLGSAVVWLVKFPGTTIFGHGPTEAMGIAVAFTTVTVGLLIIRTVATPIGTTLPMYNDTVVLP